MKSKILAALAALLIAATGFFVLTAPAKAQSAVSATCVAQSEYAIGQWVSYSSMDDACNNAMYQCRLRTPAYGTCYIVRRWFNY